MQRLSVVSTTGLLDANHFDANQNEYEIKYSGVQDSHDMCCRHSAAWCGDQTVYSFEVLPTLSALLSAL